MISTHRPLLLTICPAEQIQVACGEINLIIPVLSHMCSTKVLKLNKLLGMNTYILSPTPVLSPQSEMVRRGGSECRSWN